MRFRAAATHSRVTGWVAICTGSRSQSWHPLLQDLGSHTSCTSLDYQALLENVFVENRTIWEVVSW